MDGIRQMRGLTATATDTMDDPRVSGTGAIVGNWDGYGDVGTQWGTYRLENANGAWEGTWRGVIWNRGGGTEHTMWLTGSGAYEGLTYYAHIKAASMSRASSSPARLRHPEADLSRPGWASSRVQGEPSDRTPSAQFRASEAHPARDGPRHPGPGGGTTALVKFPGANETR